MDGKRRNEVLTGSVVALALGLVLVVFVVKGTLGELFQPAGVVRVVLADVRGVKPGDPAFFLGAKVGHVTGIEFVRRHWGVELPALFPGESGETTRVLVTLGLDKRILEYLRVDSPVEINKNITGNISVLIHEGQGPRLPPVGAVLRGRPGVELGAIAEQVDAVLKKFDPAVEDFARLAHGLGRSEDLQSAIKDLAHVARLLREGIGPLKRSLDEAISEVRGILQENRVHIRAATSELAEGAALVRKLLGRIEPAAGELQSTLKELEKAGAAVSSLIEPHREGLRTIIEEARALVSNATNITQEIRRRPWRLLHRPSKAEEESLNLYDAAWAYNLGAAELEKSLRDLSARLSAGSGQASGSEEIQAAYRQVEASLRRHAEAEEAFWARLRAR